MKYLFLFSFSLFFSVCFSQNIDAKSKKIIDKSVAEMGGYKNWNQIKHLEWQQGWKKIYWDKHNHLARVETKSKQITTLLNISNVNQSKVFINQTLITDPEIAKKQIKQDLNYWKMSIYKLAMPWKLEDPGVVIKYLKKGKTETNESADILEVTFDNNNSKYWIYITKKEHLLTQCDYFKNKNQTSKKFSLYWHNYQNLQNVLISFNNTNKKGPKNLKIEQEYTPDFFTEYEFQKN